MKKVLMLFVGLGLVLGLATAQASMKDMKAYKEAFPGATVKCIDCHVDAMPKKDDGKHDSNSYGKAVMGAIVKPDVTPTAATFKKVGTVEDFKKK